MMDDQNASDAAVRAAVEKIVGPLADAVARLATSENDERYAQHLLLRWLMTRGDADLKERYLASIDDWKVGSGHPWPLIQLYRGILLRASEPEKAVERVLNGAEIAFATRQGPVVRLIGACCRVIASGWGTPWPEGDAELRQLNKSLPAASEQIEALRVAFENAVEPFVAEACTPV